MQPSFINPLMKANLLCNSTTNAGWRPLINKGYGVCRLDNPKDDRMPFLELLGNFKRLQAELGLDDIVSFIASR